ncbi:MAG TPA: TM2 domain-containing protein [Gemmataceae bacterium]|nr:TM2 domain-containing protein [Gemmataceae bacterium]
MDLAMLAVLDTLIEDPMIFKWAKQQLDSDERRVQQFQRAYLSRKKDKTTAHMLNLVALIGIGGIHRFYIGDIPLGVAHLLTCGFCWIGTLIDVFAINQRVNLANVKVAMQTLEVVHSM